MSKKNSAVKRGLRRVLSRFPNSFSPKMFSVEKYDWIELYPGLKDSILELVSNKARNPELSCFLGSLKISFLNSL
jgi:hypothetical protein